MGGIGVIHNPFAKGNLRRPWLAGKLHEAVKGAGELWETKNINELPRVAEDFLRKKLEILAVNGGDGTIHLAVSAFIKVYGDQPLPKIISLRGGTMNTMANSLKLKGKNLGILHDAVEKVKTGEPMKELKQNLLKVNDKYGFMSGAGIVANFLDTYYSTSNPSPWQAAKIVGTATMSGIIGGKFAKSLFRPADVKVTIDGKQLPNEQFTGVLGCSIKEVGLGLKPTFRAYDHPEQFHFIATDINPFPFAVRVPAFWFERDWVHPRVQHSGTAGEVVVEPKAPIRWTVDGEMYSSAEPLRFSVGPSLAVLSP